MAVIALSGDVAIRVSYTVLSTRLCIRDSHAFLPTKRWRKGRLGKCMQTAAIHSLTFSNLHSSSPRFSEAMDSQRDSNRIKLISNLEEAMFNNNTDTQCREDLT